MYPMYWTPQPPLSKPETTKLDCSSFTLQHNRHLIIIIHIIIIIIMLSRFSLARIGTKWCTRRSTPRVEGVVMINDQNNKWNMLTMIIEIGNLVAGTCDDDNNNEQEENTCDYYRDDDDQQEDICEEDWNVDQRQGWQLWWWSQQQPHNDDGDVDEQNEYIRDVDEQKENICVMIMTTTTRTMVIRMIMNKWKIYMCWCLW